MLQHIKLDLIIPGEGQPRKTFYEDTLEELAQSIRERGVLEPIVVRPRSDGRYSIIMGERRYRASKLAGLEEIPAIVRECSEEEARLDALLENFQREDLNPVERARAIEELLSSYTHEQVAKQLGVTEATIRRHLEILDLPQAVLDEMVDRPGEAALTEGHALALKAISDDPVSQVRLARKVREERLTRDELSRLISACQGFPDKKEAILRVPLKVAEEMIRHAAKERGLKRHRPFKPQTAQTHASNLAKAITQLHDLLDDRLVDFISNEELSTLMASMAALSDDLQKLTSKVRKALSEDRSFQEIYLNCAVCGRLELINKLRCSTCWSVMKRCVDCANYDQFYQQCSVFQANVPSSEAEAPDENSRSYKCEDYSPKFTGRRAA